MRNVALDWGKRISYCEVKDGQVVTRQVVRSLDELRPLLGPETKPAKVAIEACREAWYVHDCLKEWGHEPILVDTTRVRELGIGHHRRKNDRIDAETLARRLEKDDIPRAHVLSPAKRKLRGVLAVRSTLVGLRAQLVVAVRGHLRANGVHLKSGRTQDFVVNLAGVSLPEPLDQQLAPLVKQLKDLELSIAMAERQVENLVAAEPVIKLLQTAPGVGPIVAAAVVSVIDDPKRFKRAHQVESYVGLVPSENTSGKRRLGAISKQGNSQLRSLLLQSAWALLRQRGEEPLKQWGKHVQERRGKGVGAVAVARRLLGILWAMWRDDTAYDPEQLGRQSAEGIDREAQRASFRASAIALAGRKAVRRRQWVEKILQRQAVQMAP